MTPEDFPEIIEVYRRALAAGADRPVVLIFAGPAKTYRPKKARYTWVPRHGALLYVMPLAEVQHAFRDAPAFVADLIKAGHIPVIIFSNVRRLYHVRNQ